MDQSLIDTIIMNILHKHENDQNFSYYTPTSIPEPQENSSKKYHFVD